MFNNLSPFISKVILMKISRHTDVFHEHLEKVVQLL